MRFHTARVIRVTSTSGKASPHVRYASNSDRNFASRRTYAMCHEPTYAVQQLWSLLDHLIGGGEQHRRYFDAKRPGGFEIDRQFELGRCLHRKFGRLLALENTIDIAGG